MNVMAGDTGVAVLDHPVPSGAFTPPADLYPLSGARADEQMNLLCDLHSKAVYRYLLRRTLGDRREAEDVLQETLLRAWRYLRERPLAVETLRPWLFTVARRVLIDAVRARQVRPTEVGAFDPAVIPTMDDDVERMLNIQTVRRALMALSVEHREVLVEVYYKERSVKEVAETLGIPEGTVKSRTYYALRALRVAACAAGLES